MTYWTEGTSWTVLIYFVVGLKYTSDLTFHCRHVDDVEIPSRRQQEIQMGGEETVGNGKICICGALLFSLFLVYTVNFVI